LLRIGSPDGRLAALCVLTTSIVLAGPAPQRPVPPPPVPEFAALLRLLRERQGIDLGAAVTADTLSAALAHYQRFHGLGGTAGVLEEHRDGTIYLVYTPARGPEWYDVRDAEDLEGVREGPIPAGRGHRSFEDLMARNVNESRWMRPSEAFPDPLGPSPRWITFALPLSDPCAADRRKHDDLAASLREAPADRVGRMIWEVEKPVRRLELQHLTKKLAGAACRPHVAATWRELMAEDTVEGARIRDLMGHVTTPLDAPGDYCYRNVVTLLDALKTGPPSWQTILPENTLANGLRKAENGQKRLPGEKRDVSWSELKTMMQTSPALATRVLKWNGRPSREDITSRRIPWISSDLEGVVTESFLSGSDYAGNHYDAPANYWLGDSADARDSWEVCGMFEARHALCNDWITFVAPQPEYRFLLTREFETEPGEVSGRGNFTGELRGNLENEIEQWMVPAGFRPEPGDRIHLTGRWIVDCAHEDWHGELHPVESYVTEHAVDNDAVGSLVVTSDWPGGDLDQDVWPLARPAAGAMLAWHRDRAHIAGDLNVTESMEPRDNPNHLHVHVASRSPRTPLPTGDWNEVAPDTTRQVAIRYRLTWK
jgi:hypothetical protein